MEHFLSQIADFQRKMAEMDICVELGNSAGDGGLGGSGCHDSSIKIRPLCLPLWAFIRG